MTFFYDHGTHWITTDAQDPIVTAPGSFQSELGCAADWVPDCMRSWLKDPDGDGVYSLVVSGLPAGTYEVKAAHGRSWDENYGAGGVLDGGNIAFTVPSGSPDVVFTYELATHLLGVATREPEAVPDLSTADAHWVSPGLVAWDVSEAASRSYRLHWSRSGALEVDDETIGGDSVPLAWDPLGLPAAVVAAHPELEGFEAFRLRRQDRWLAVRIGGAQLGVASYDPDGRLHDATGLDRLWP